jgi:ATP-dependent protease ClpP protease subunit
LATSKKLRETIPPSDAPEMLSKINKHFFPDKERVLQSFIYLKGDISLTSCSEVIETIIERNTPSFEIDEEQDDVLVESPPEDVINLLITSNGGDMSASFALINVIKASKIPIRTIAIGEASSAALCILMAGHQRVCAPYTTLLSHQFATGAEGPYHELKNIMAQFDVYFKNMVELYKEYTGQDEEYITSTLLTTKDVYLSPEQGKDLNFVDLVSDLA